MKHSALTIAVGLSAACWLPYIAMRAFWMLYVSMFPGDEHGELSGPVLYFLPILLWLATIASACVVAIFAFGIAWRQIRNK